MPHLPLRQRDAQILYLGLLHGEARPGRGLATRSGGRGAAEPIAPLRALLEGELERAIVEIDVPDEALPLLGEALGAAINELKQLAMADGRSMVPGFAEALRRFFPEIDGEPSAALDVVGHGVMLRRRLDAVVRAGGSGPPEGAAPEADRRPLRRRWSRLWRR